MRVTDDMVEHALTWARNYGEIASFKQVEPSGRKWLIKLPSDVPLEGPHPSAILTNRVPEELVLTSREALTFAYGCAAAGARPEPRQAFARREWGWYGGILHQVAEGD